jgi:dTDP-4-dehydrorhamnose reductase
VVGGDSFLGQQLCRELHSANQSFMFTSRRPNRQGSLQLDLSQPPNLWPGLPRVQQAVLCAGITSMDACEKDPGATHNVNVAHTLALARKLTLAGAFVVFLSTSLVFDGAVLSPSEEDATNPFNEYTRHKVEVEQGLANLVPRPAVLRLTKVVSPGYPLFNSWGASLVKGEEIRPFQDLLFAPVSMEAALHAIITVLSSHKGGTWHFSGQESVSYAGACIELARQIGAESALVQPVPANLAKLPYPTLPKHANLGMEATTRELGLLPQPFPEAIRSCLPS